MNFDGRIDGGDGKASREGTRSHADIAHLLAVPAEASHRRRRIMLFAGFALLTLLAIYLAMHRNQAASFNADPAAQAPLVSVAVPGRAMVAGTINATGALAARHEMDVGSVGDGGEVREVLVNPGQWVRAGQLLARVDRSVQAQQLANSDANIAVAAADARLAEANLARALRLVGDGFISRANIDQLTATRDAAVARVRVARAVRGEQAARNRRLDIVAPAAGLVLERAVEPGTVVGPASGVLFRIAQDGEMELRARLSESDLTQLSVGEEARVTPVGSARSFTGHIWLLSPMIDAQSRQGEARVALAYAPDLRPGGFASAALHAGSLLAPLLPESALQADARGSYVYVVGAGDKAERRPIRIGMVTEHGVAVASGLSGDERVVLRAGAFLSNGERVKPRLVPAATP